ncbi:MAG: tetratricopeptide repeat protein [Oscillospiraceae bacterium]|nr:tetratricopeptide repeat protein [Oscillospiraceae bacterium]
MKIESSKLKKTGNKDQRYLILIAVLLVLLAVVAVSLLHYNGTSGPKEYTQKARECYAAGDYESALLYLRRGMEKESNTEGLMLMADCYEALGNYPKALETLRKMNTSDPAVASRILSIEQKRSKEQKAKLIVVAGCEFEEDTKDVVLDEKGITNEQLSEITTLYSLNSLSLKNNRISDISALSALGGLDELDLSGNQLSSVDALAALRELRTLKLDGNPIRDCRALAVLSNLNTLSLTETEVTSDCLEILTEALPFCAIRYTNEETEEVLYGGNCFHADVTDLNLSGKKIRDLTALDGFSELRTLNLSNNEIIDLRPLMNLPKLEELVVSDNSISDLRPLIGLSSLKKLDASDNLVSDTTAVGEVKSLEELYLNGNLISIFSGLGKLSGLKSLYLRNTGISDTDLPELHTLKSLQTLDLQNNTGLSEKTVSALKSEIPGCTILTSELIYEVDFAGHTVQSDEKILSFPYSNITVLSGLDRMTRLEELDLSNNEITSLYQFEISPSRYTLVRLNLSGNQISDILSLSSLTMLEELNLSDNMIAAVTGLKKLQTLKKLNLSGNPVLIEQLDELREALPDCEIIYP